MLYLPSCVALRVLVVNKEFSVQSSGVELASTKSIFTVSVWDGYCFQPQQSGKGYILIPGLCSVKASPRSSSSTGYKQQLFAV